MVTSYARVGSQTCAPPVSPWRAESFMIRKNRIVGSFPGLCNEPVLGRHYQMMNASRKPGVYTAETGENRKSGPNLNMSGCFYSGEVDQVTEWREEFYQWQRHWTSLSHATSSYIYIIVKKPLTSNKTLIYISNLFQAIVLVIEWPLYLTPPKW